MTHSLNLERSQKWVPRDSRTRMGIKGKTNRLQRNPVWTLGANVNRCEVNPELYLFSPKPIFIISNLFQLFPDWRCEGGCEAAWSGMEVWGITGISPLLPNPTQSRTPTSSHNHKTHTTELRPGGKRPHRLKNESRDTSMTKWDHLISKWATARQDETIDNETTGNSQKLQETTGEQKQDICISYCSSESLSVTYFVFHLIL